MEETENKPQKKIRGRTWSQITTCLSILVLLVCSILKWFNKLPGADITEIIAVSASIKATAAPIDINMLVDKFKRK